MELQTDEFDLRELLDGVLNDALALAEPLGLTVEAEVPERLSLKADPPLSGMITQNLIENAIKYNSPGGRARIAAREVNGSIELTIGNTGEGIPRERALHLFERFHRVRGDERIAGSGPGLSTARELARAHGGDVALLRSDSTWTELHVRLPQAA